MGRSVSYPSAAKVVTFAHMEPVEYMCNECDGTGKVDCEECEGTGNDNVPEYDPRDCDECEGHGQVDCPNCQGSGTVMHEPDGDDFDQLIEDFQQHLKHLFPSVEPADEWIGREDHVLAENRLAQFGMSEYCGLVAYWIVPKEYSGPKGELYYSSDRFIEPMSTHWVKSISDKFVAAFGELTKVGSMSNGEGVYRRIDR